MTVRLWTRQGFRDDSWRHAAEGEAAADGVILPLSAYLALADEQRSSFRLGVRVKPGEALDELVPLLGSTPLIALEFPAFNDGRSYSKAERLRGALGWKGVLRAVGDVLADQIPHMLRLGFDELEVSHPVAIARLQQGLIAAPDAAYQPTAASSGAPASYSWRRRTAG